MINQAKIILKEIFGYKAFRPLQGRVIESILNGNDTLVIMPTGGGKSLCYQIPALIFSGLTVVVSPLISLMKDQVEQLSEAGVPAVLLNSTLSSLEYRRNVGRIKNLKAKLLYLAPESLLRSHILDILSATRVDCLAIDEAHCISEWGHDFRPEYRQLAKVREMFPRAVCTALTATATNRVRNDIKTALDFQSRNEFIGSFNRENLFLEVQTKENSFDQIIRFLKKYPDQSGIIYCATRKQVDALALSLKKIHFSVLPYHAGLSDEERKHNQELFIKDDIQIVVATIAFGMGINKPNVRFVIHFDMPRNMESYYQEIGRAGRDGLNAHCLLLFGYGDINKIKHFIKQKNPDEKRIATIHLNAFLRFIECRACRRVPLLGYFGETFSAGRCTQCDNCAAGETEKVDITIPAQKFLSCVKRTGESFGAVHIIDVLRGSKSKKVLRFGHDRLSTYDIGNNLSKREWMVLFRQFIHQDLITQNMEFGGLLLTQKAWDVLRGKRVVMGWFEDARNKGDTAAAIEDSPVPKYDQTLFEILRVARKKIADQAQIPPYVIFPDKTLIGMASKYPQSDDDLLSIHGIGAAKLEKYGAVFLGIICQYCHKESINTL